MTTWIRRLTVLLLVAGIVVGVNGSPALALGPSGCGSTCNGQDPATYLVSWGNLGLEPCDAKTIGSKLEVADSGHYVELRYSPYCRTAWARHSWDSSYDGTAQVWVESYQGPSTGTTFLRAYADSHRCTAPQCAYPTLQGTYIGNTSGPWSFMVNDAGLYARACIRWHGLQEHYPNDFVDRCTPLY